MLMLWVITLALKVCDAQEDTNAASCVHAPIPRNNISASQHKSAYSDRWMSVQNDTSSISVKVWMELNWSYNLAKCIWMQITIWLFQDLCIKKCNVRKFQTPCQIILSLVFVAFQNILNCTIMCASVPTDQLIQSKLLKISAIRKKMYIRKSARWSIKTIKWCGLQIWLKQHLFNVMQLIEWAPYVLVNTGLIKNVNCEYQISLIDILQWVLILPLLSQRYRKTFHNFVICLSLNSITLLTKWITTSKNKIKE